MSDCATNPALDYYSETYRNAYRRVNGIVIEGEKQAYDNFIRLAELLPEYQAELTRLAKMEARHQKSFVACGQNLKVSPDLDFAAQFFAELHQIFASAANAGQVATCLVVQALIIECFAIAAYNTYLPVADEFARKVTASVVQDEYSHLNFGEVWLQNAFEQCKDEIITANRLALPLIWKMLNQVTGELRILGMDKASLVEDFSTRYGEALGQIGFKLSEILSLSVQGLQAVTP
uniref:Aldehyde decarbonylase n=1 Tax=Cyanothece sp. (strain PCC 7425 / ATCC 29141) TaxID=395961 RepID=B8HLW2_CYAP4